MEIEEKDLLLLLEKLKSLGDFFDGEYNDGLEEWDLYDELKIKYFGNK